MKRRGRTPVALSLVLVLIISGYAAGLRLGSSNVPGSDSRRRLRLVTFDNSNSWRAGYLKLSAAKNQVPVEVLGQAVDMRWARSEKVRNFGVRITELRKFLNAQVDDHDVVLFLDAYDTAVTAGANEILQAYDALRSANPGKEIFFNAEDLCFPKGEWCDAELRKAEAEPLSGGRGVSSFKYLNAGAFIGMGKELKSFFNEGMVVGTADDDWDDQHVYHEEFVAGKSKELVGLDRSCGLFMTSLWGPPDALKANVKNGRLINSGQGACPQGSPPVLHFEGTAHWLKPAGDLRSGRAMQEMKEERDNFEAEKGRTLAGTLSSAFEDTAKISSYLGKGMMAFVNGGGDKLEAEAVAKEFFEEARPSTQLQETFKVLFPQEGAFLESFQNHEIGTKRRIPGHPKKAEACKGCGSSAEQQHPEAFCAIVKSECGL